MLKVAFLGSVALIILQGIKDKNQNKFSLIINDLNFNYMVNLIDYSINTKAAQK